MTEFGTFKPILFWEKIQKLGETDNGISHTSNTLVKDVMCGVFLQRVVI